MKLTVLALGAFLTAALHGATLYDTLGPDNKFQLSGNTIGGSNDIVVANWIHSVGNGPVTSIELAMAHTSGENLYRLDLVTALGAGPSDNSFYHQEFSVSGNLTTLNVQNGPSLDEDHDIWLVISGIGLNTQGAWWANGNGILGTLAWQNLPQNNFASVQATWSIMGDQVVGGARINSDIEPSAVPEPSTALLAAPALLLLGWVRRKRS